MVLVDGAPALLIERGKAITFAGAAPEVVAAALTQGLPMLAASARRTLSLESIDGTKTLVSPLAPVLDRAGFRRDYKGYTVPPSPLSAPAPVGVADDAEVDDDDEDDGGEALT